MTSDALTVGLAVGIPSGVILLFLAAMWYRTRHRMRKEDQENVESDKRNNIDLEGDLTFDNFQHLAAPQLPVVNADSEETIDVNVARAKSHRYRSYSYHPNIKKEAGTPDTNQSSKTEGSANDSLITLKSGGPKNEQILQNYFEGIVPVVPESTDNSDARSGSSDKRSKRSRSFFHRPSSSANLASAESSDSLSHQQFLKSLNRNVLETSDFHMPIPGSNRTSVILEQRGLCTSIAELSKQPRNLVPPTHNLGRQFYIESDSDGLLEVLNPFQL